MSTTIKEQLIKEIEELPSDAQWKILKLVHFIREEIFMPEKVKSKDMNALSDMDQFVIETGISDLSYQHDHYLYGTPKK